MPPLKTSALPATSRWLDALGARPAPCRADPTPTRLSRLLAPDGGATPPLCKALAPLPPPRLPALLERREHHACSIDSPWPHLP